MKAKQLSIAVSGALFALAASFAPASLAACKECGTVTEVKTVKKEGEGSGVGAVIGGVAGGVLGHQIGGGRGKDVATVAGAAGGAYVGHQVEKNQKSTTTYVVRVKMEDGANRSFNFSAPTSYRAGDKVKVVNKKLVRQQ
jgi:uncharacterized protein YcfJ